MKIKTHAVKTLLITSIATGLFGCAAPTGPGDLRKETPALKITSKKPAIEVAICIADFFDNPANKGFGATGPLASTSPAVMRPTKSGYVISFTMTGQIGMIVDVDEAQGGSVTRYYKGAALQGQSSIDGVKGCQ